MDSQDINFLIEKYSRPQSDHSSKFPIYSPKSLTQPSRELNSKAYAGAMRALQDRITFLEAENSELFEKLKLTEENYQHQRKLSEIPTDYYHPKSLDALKKELLSSQHTVETLSRRVRQLESSDINEIYNENLKLKQELDAAMRELSARKCQEISQNLQIHKLEEEKGFLQEELTKSRLDLRDHPKIENPAKSSQQEDNKRSRESKRRKTSNLRSQRETRTLAATGKKSVSFRKSLSRSRLSHTSSPTSPRLHSNRHIGAHLAGTFSDRIEQMEAEMEELNKKYRRLLISSKSESSGLERLRQEIDEVAEELETKGHILYNLKLKQKKLRTKKVDSVLI